MVIMRQLTIIIISLHVALFACGSKRNNHTGDAGGDGNDATSDSATADALIPVNCVPGSTQCTDCIDNDGDGRADGFDPECTGPLDNNEGSFATGIPGDNVDPVKQDCFFDGNSGGSPKTDCQIHVCCLLGATDQASCPVGANQYDPSACAAPQTDACRTSCQPLVPPGCDCFGCCTVCDPATNQCRDILINSAFAPDCSQETLLDQNACKSCVKVQDCGSSCDPQNCILCPGQDPSDLPASCGGSNTCGAGEESCTNAACPADKYCANGCCVTSVLF